MISLPLGRLSLRLCHAGQARSIALLIWSEIKDFKGMTRATAFGESGPSCRSSLRRISMHNGAAWKLEHHTIAETSRHGDKQNHESMTTHGETSRLYV